ncbi:pyruvate kinase, partial [Patescibacteria group bacterium]|nr:pyruvate kinase [Patescibacteria group bacterium]
IVGGDIKGRRGVNLPGAYLSVSSITEKDRKDLEFGIKNKVDFIALSFVRRPDDIIELRNILNKAKLSAGIIAKIETPEAVENIDKIIELADGIMVARGDLAIEVPAEDVPLIQKMIIEKCNKAGKPVITATQMLESMIKSPVPTRAEISDVANAILDGTDAIMLSEETTLGDYPVEAVKVMYKVARRVESDFVHGKINGEKKLRTDSSKDTADAITGEAVDIASGVDARFIIGLTESGFSARMISRYRPAQDIIAMTPNKNTFNKLILSYGIVPVLIPKFRTLNEAMVIIRNHFLKNKLAKKGDKVVVVAGMPFGKKGATNMILVEKM